MKYIYEVWDNKNYYQYSNAKDFLAKVKTCPDNYILYRLTIDSKIKCIHLIISSTRSNNPKEIEFNKMFYTFYHCVNEESKANIKKFNVSKSELISSATISIIIKDKFTLKSVGKYRDLLLENLLNRLLAYSDADNTVADELIDRLLNEQEKFNSI